MAYQPTPIDDSNQDPNAPVPDMGSGQDVKILPNGTQVFNPDTVVGNKSPAPINVPVGDGKSYGLVSADTTGAAPKDVNVKPLTEQGLVNADVAALQKQKEAGKNMEAIKSAEQGAEANIWKDQADKAQSQYDDLVKVSNAFQYGQDLHRGQERAEAIALGNSKIDQDHWWNSKSTGGKVEGIIGLILGGIGQGLQMYAGNKQAHNYALDAMDKAITEDINIQDSDRKTRVDALAKRIGITDSEANQNHLALLDKQNQYIIAQQVFAAKLKQAAAQSGSAEAIQNANDFGAKLDQQIAVEQRNLGMYGEKLAAAGAAGLQSFQKDLLQRQRAQEDSADKMFETLTADGRYTPQQIVTMVQQMYPGVSKFSRIDTTKLPSTVPEKPEAGAAAKVKSDEDNRLRANIVASAKAAALRGETPPKEVISEAAKLGIDLPGVSNGTIFGNAKDVNDAYAPLEQQYSTKPETKAPVATTPTPDNPSGLPPKK